MNSRQRQQKMSARSSAYVRFILKTLLALAGVFVLLLLVIAAFICFLPNIVESPRVKGLLESTLSETLGGPVHMDRLCWTWEKGLETEGFILSDGLQFSEKPLISIKKARLLIDFSGLFRLKPGLTLIISGVELNLIREADGRLNLLEGLAGKDQAEPLPSKPEPLPEKQKKPFSLPMDLSADLELSDICVDYHDRARQQRLTVHNAFIRLNVPSLKNSPATLAVDMDMAVNQRDIPHSSLTATVQHLFDAQGRLSLHQVLFSLQADLPGTRAAFSGNMAESGITGDTQIRLALLFDTLSPLMPETTAKMEVAGDITLSAGVSMKPDEPLRFDARLDAADIALSGGPIGEKSLQDGNLQLHVSGAFDQKKQTLTLDPGEMAFLHKGRIQFSGRIQDITSGHPVADLTIAPLFLDLDETAHFFKAFLPEQLAPGDAKDGSSLSLSRAVFSGNLPDGPARVQLTDLALGLPRILFFIDKTKASSLALEGARLQVQNLQTELSAGLPVSAAIQASLEIDRFLKQNGKDGLSISGLHLGPLMAEAQDIQKAEHSLLAVQADVTLSDSLSIAKIHIPDQLDIQGLDQSLSARASLHSDGSATGTLEGLNLTLPLSLNSRPSGPFDTVCKIRITLPEFTLSGVNPPHVDINGLTTHINLDDLLVARLEAGMADSGRSGITLDAKMTADLLRLFEHYLQKQLPGITARGDASLTLHAKGRVPDARMIDRLQSLRIDGNLEFLEDLQIEARLQDGGLNLARRDAPPMDIPSISGEPLLRYRLSGKDGRGRLDAHLRISGIKDIQGVRMSEPLSADLSIGADHRFMKGFAFHQNLSVEPLDIHQNLQISVEGLDAVLSQKPLPDPSSWISSIGVAASADIEIPDCAKLKTAAPSAMTSMDIEGAVSGLARLQLTPGQEINGGLRLVLNRISMDMPDRMTLQKISGDIDLSKRYFITPATPADETGQLPSLLSWQVLQPPAAGGGLGSPENSNLHRHLSLLTERIRSSPDLSMKTARFQSLPFPLVINGSRIMIHQQEGIPSLDYFQAELLGGTINGFMSLRKRESGFFIESEINLSGINTGLIFPEAASRIPDAEAEISGFLYAEIPVRDRLKPLLDDTTLTVEFTRIGSRALERVLYALDPYESNEVILSQRRLLRAGTPRRVRLEVKDGFLSLTGEVSVKSLTLPLPALRRLNISSVPGIEKFESGLSGLTPVIAILNTLTSRRMAIEKDTGGVRFY